MDYAIPYLSIVQREKNEKMGRLLARSVGIEINDVSGENIFLLKPYFYFSSRNKKFRAVGPVELLIDLGRPCGYISLNLI